MIFDEAKQTISLFSSRSFILVMQFIASKVPAKSAHKERNIPCARSFSFSFEIYEIKLPW